MASTFLRSSVALVLFAPLALYANGAPSQTVNLSTASGASRFLITGAGATAAPAFQVSTGISLTSTAILTGTFVTGGSLGSFTGLWYADEAFTIPADATNVSLVYSGLVGDDRTVMQLNGTTITSVGGVSTGGLTVFAFPPSGIDAPYTLTGVTSGTVTTGFNIGGSNTLWLIVNNTGGLGPLAPTATFSGVGDGSSVRVTATLYYDQPVTPLPAGFWFALAGLLALIAGHALYRRPAWRKA